VSPRAFPPLVALALAAALACGRGDGATRSRDVVPVERRTFAATVTAVGAVQPRIGAEVRVGSRISGQVRRLRANIGDRVEQGQVIAELETADLDATVAERRAELRLAEARLAALDALGPDEEARAAADVSRFEAAARLAEQEWERVQALLRQGGVTQSEADAARERHEGARSQLEAARHALNLVRDGTVEQRRQAEAERDRARSALDRAVVDRSFAVITAPLSGIVASVSTQEGETVAAGLNAPTFVTIVDLDRLQVHAYVDEVDIGKVLVGQRASFTVDAYPARDFEGRVAAIYPSATIQDNVVKYVVAVDIAGDSAEDTNAVLRPEMTASVRIELEARQVLALPVRAIRREEGRSVVYVRERGRPARREVRLGWRDGPWVEIVEGLNEGEQVLLDPPAGGGA
jgi:multidrug efflux pump subunit AcrA (membrane-fusion protein)